MAARTPGGTPNLRAPLTAKPGTASPIKVHQKMMARAVIIGFPIRPTGVPQESDRFSVAAQHQAMDLREDFLDERACPGELDCHNRRKGAEGQDEGNCVQW